MELYQLKTFVKIADEGSLTKAAALLFTSQPAISAQIKALEEELGVTLFDRSSRGMTLTAKGLQLYAHAQATLEAAERLREGAQQLRQELVGELRIGINTDVEFLRLGELHRQMAASHAQIRPHFLQSMSAKILPDIRRGALDGGFFFGDCRLAGLAVDTLQMVPIRLVAPASWGAAFTAAGIEDLARMPWVYTSDDCPFRVLARELFAPTGIEPRKVAYADSEDTVRELIRAGAGLSMLRLDDAQQFERDGEGVVWKGEAPDMALRFAVRQQRAAEPMIQALRTIIGQVWQRDSGDTATALV